MLRAHNEGTVSRSWPLASPYLLSLGNRLAGSGMRIHSTAADQALQSRALITES